MSRGEPCHVLGVGQLGQMGRLDAILPIAYVGDDERGVPRADPHDVRKDVRPRPSGRLLMHASSVAVPGEDQTTILGANGSIQEQPPSLLDPDSGRDAPYTLDHVG